MWQYFFPGFPFSKMENKYRFLWMAILKTKNYEKKKTKNCQIKCMSNYNMKNKKNYNPCQRFYKWLYIYIHICIYTCVIYAYCKQKLNNIFFLFIFPLSLLYFIKKGVKIPTTAQHEFLLFFIYKALCYRPIGYTNWDGIKYCCVPSPI